MRNILAIDPGKYKSGLAVIDSSGAVIEKFIAKTLVLSEEIRTLCYKHGIRILLIGNGGPGRMIEKKVSSMDLNASIVFVNEKGSTLEARRLYWKENPPGGIFRLFPRSLLFPREAYDDYAAIVIGRRYLKESRR